MKNQDRHSELVQISRVQILQKADQYPKEKLSEAKRQGKKYSKGVDVSSPSQNGGTPLNKIKIITPALHTSTSQP